MKVTNCGAASGNHAGIYGAAGLLESMNFKEKTE